MWNSLRGIFLIRKLIPRNKFRKFIKPAFSIGLKSTGEKMEKKKFCIVS